MRIILIKIGKFLPYMESSNIPLGLLYLSSYLLDKRKDVDIKIVDMGAERLSPGDVSSIVSGYRPDIVGLSSMSTDATLLHATAKEIKENLSTALIIAGGPHPTTDPEDTLKNKDIDIAVIGEGEETFFEIVSAIENGNELRDINGIAYKKNGDFFINERRKFIEDIDTLPIPAWDIIDLELYSKHFGMAPWAGKRKYASILTSRGCPYRCTFCHNIFGKKFRARSPENVIKEIEFLYTNGVRDFEILDDIFNFDYTRTEKILDMILSHNLKINIDFPNGLRGDILDEKIIKKLRMAGTRSIAFAVETASERIQRLIKKNNRLDKLNKAIEISDKEGIFNVGYFMFGFPTETLEEMKQTIKFALHSNLHVAFFFVLNPFKGTDIYKEIKEHEIPVPLSNEYESYFYVSKNYSNVPMLRMKIYLRLGLMFFYLYRLRIVKTIIRIPTKRYLLSLMKIELIRLFNIRIFKNRTPKLANENTACKPFAS